MVALVKPVSVYLSGHVSIVLPRDVGEELVPQSPSKSSSMELIPVKMVIESPEEAVSQVVMSASYPEAGPNILPTKRTAKRRAKRRVA